jgi:tetratricopeptide (TPR) repeat protein
VPLDWAGTQDNLGNALLRLGERERSIQRLREAIDAYKAALQERTRERVPLHWAGTQNNLGNALLRLGERENSTQRLDEAVVAYKAALQEITRQQASLDWAMIQNSLGNALLRLGEHESSTQRLDAAVVAYKAALQVFKSGYATYYFVRKTKANLQRTEDLLRERRSKIRQRTDGHRNNKGPPIVSSQAGMTARNTSS